MIHGDGGDDAIVVESGAGTNNKLYGDSGEDTIDARESASKVTVYGGDGADYLYGGSGGDTLSGGLGDDTLSGGAGNDRFIYADGGGNDTIKDYASGQDVLEITEGSVTKTELVNKEKDVVCTVGSGSITLTNVGKNAVSITDSRGSYTASGTEIILSEDFTGKLNASAYLNTVAKIDGKGATGAITVTGNTRNSTIYGGMGNDTLTGGKGKDTINGGAGNDKLYGGTGNDTLSGSAGDDNLYGQDGDDYLSGGAGDDYLSGGAGNDSLSGDAGNDTFFFASQTPHGNDIIWDYEAGDTIAFANTSMYTGEYGLSNNDVILNYADGDEGMIKIVGGKGMTISFINGPYETHTFN